MNGLKYFFYIICLLSICYITGCTIVPSGHISAGDIEIDYGPPPSPYVVITRPPPPSRLHVWIKGSYIISGNKWAWREGHWDAPPRRGKVWVPDRTRQKGQVWIWTPGRWR